VWKERGQKSGMGSFGPFGNDLFVICDMTFPKDVSELETRVTSTIAFLVSEPSGSDTYGLAWSNTYI